MQSSASINLVKQKVNILDQAVKWSLTVGRTLVIITEIVAFSTFVYRFTLDRNLIDLHSKIKNEQIIIENASKGEAQYRNLQARIGTANTAMNKGTSQIKILDGIVSLTPSEISFDSFSIQSNQINISMTVRSTAALDEFIKSLRSYEPIATATILGVSTKSSSGILTVSVNATLK